MFSYLHRFQHVIFIRNNNKNLYKFICQDKNQNLIFDKSLQVNICKKMLCNGKLFEEKTNNHLKLLEYGYVKHCFTNKKYDFYLAKRFTNKNIIFVLQGGAKKYIKDKYNIEIFRYPDEAYIIENDKGKKIIKILEKKEQNVNGSIEMKLWCGPSLKREYELLLGDMFEVHYGFCINDFLKKKIISNEKKYIVLYNILCENNIDILYGDDDNYFETVKKWIDK